ncbi:MAG: MFS transporter, partial [Candidatus Lokiarchaeota archaeon]|nr:MFS transporter [Candidatus Lokiarchaeota archaeon]MBD3342067.1 MFS transporter [Candidatus Lokiarchaeota archaeon]
MEKNSQNRTILIIVLFIIILALANSTQYMISPNLILISNYFGYGSNLTPLGFLTFSFIGVSGISMLFFGYLADKFTRKWIVFAGVSLFSLSSSLIILVPAGRVGYQIFFLLTLIIGVSFGIIIPSIFSLIGDFISRKNRSKGLSFFSISSLFGMVIGLTLATFIGEFDWRISYLIVGIFMTLNALLVLRISEPSRMGKDYVELTENNTIEYSYRIKREDIKYVFKKKSNVWLVVNFVDTIPTGIILFLLFAYMEVYHNVHSIVALTILLLALISTLLGTIFFGFVGDKKYNQGNKKARVKLALLGNIIPIPFVFIALIIPFQVSNNSNLLELLVEPGLILMIFLFSIGLFINGAVNGNWYATVVDINLPEHRGTVLASSNFFDIFGRAIGPLIAAIISDLYGILYGMTISIVFW